MPRLSGSLGFLTGGAVRMNGKPGFVAVTVALFATWGNPPFNTLQPGGIYPAHISIKKVESWHRSCGVHVQREEYG